MDTLNIIEKIAIWGLPVIFAITLHEASHGWVAHKFGDNTAYMMGRITANPLKHIDLIGTIIVPVVCLMLSGFVFGWAKPVPVVSKNLKNPKRDMAFVAAAGPLSNLVMALGWGAILKVGLMANSSGFDWAMGLVYMGQAGILINLVLGVLNLIPIPPLDGSRVLSSFLPAKIDYVYSKLEPYGFFILLVLLLIHVLERILAPPVFFLFHLITVIFGIR